jgi:hypothetical protein
VKKALVTCAFLAACVSPPAAPRPIEITRFEHVRTANIDEIDTRLQSGACAIGLRFGSIGMGIDHAAETALVAELIVTPGVTAIYAQPWGREGEVSYCAAVTRQDTAAVSAALDRAFARRSRKAEYPIERLEGKFR